MPSESISTAAVTGDEPQHAADNLEATVEERSLHQSVKFDQILSQRLREQSTHEEFVLQRAAKQPSNLHTKTSFIDVVQERLASMETEE